MEAGVEHQPGTISCPWETTPLALARMVGRLLLLLLLLLPLLLLLSAALLWAPRAFLPPRLAGYY